MVDGQTAMSHRRGNPYRSRLRRIRRQGESRRCLPDVPYPLTLPTPAARSAVFGLTLIAATALGLTTPTAVNAQATDGAEDHQQAAPSPLVDAVSLTVSDSLLEQPYRLGTERRIVAVEPGDTLLAILLDEGVDNRSAHNAIAALETVYDPRDLQIGQEVTLALEHNGRTSELTGLELMPDVETRALVNAGEDGFAAETLPNVLETRDTASEAEIESSLYAASNTVGIPDQVTIRVIRAFSYSVDFQRDLQPGDRFRILFERDYHTDGEFARNGPVLFAELVLGDRVMPMYRFEGDDGFIDYFDRDGLSVRRALMRTPIDGARLSSGFGMRRHPILGYTRMHRGVDFAAPTGTPILAAGDGVVDRIGPNSGYGNYIRIRHNSGLSTAYAHMSRFASGLSRGDRVMQGDVIGYVGSTGLSTGPHLHYEVLVNGSQINPLDADLPTGRQLEGAELARFQAAVAEVDGRYEAATAGDRDTAAAE